MYSFETDELRVIHSSLEHSRTWIGEIMVFTDEDKMSEDEWLWYNYRKSDLNLLIAKIGKIINDKEGV